MKNQLHPRMQLVSFSFFAFTYFVILTNTKAQTAISSASMSYYAVSYSSANDYTTPGSGSVSSPGFPTSTTYTVTYLNGSNNHLKLNTFTIGANVYSIDSKNTSSNITLQRKANSNFSATSTREILFYEVSSTDATTFNLKPAYESSIVNQLQSEVMNRGTDNLFLNGCVGCTSQYNYSNVERLDKVWSSNLKSTIANYYGFLIVERGGNDAFKIAAITAVDGSNNPTAWGSLVSVSNSSHWGSTGTSIATQVFKKDNETINNTVFNTGSGQDHTNTSDSYFEPNVSLTAQNLKGTYISFADLGIGNNQDIYGYSIFANDVPSGMNSADIADISNDTNYPTNTTTDGTLDLISGPLVVNNVMLYTAKGEMENVHVKDVMRNNCYHVPSPFQEQLIIKHEDCVEKLLKVKIYNITGDLLISDFQTEENGNFNIDTHSLETGIYLLYLEMEKSVKVVRVMKN